MRCGAVDAPAILTRGADFRLTPPTRASSSNGAGDWRVERGSCVSAGLSKEGQGGVGANSAWVRAADEWPSRFTTMSQSELVEVVAGDRTDAQAAVTQVKATRRAAWTL